MTARDPEPGPVHTVRIEPVRREGAEHVAAIWRSGWRDAHLGRVPDELVAVRTPESFATRAAEMDLVPLFRPGALSIETAGLTGPVRSGWRHDGSARDS
jgi:hypothetical protein